MLALNESSSVSHIISIAERLAKYNSQSTFIVQDNPIIVRAASGLPLGYYHFAPLQYGSENVHLKWDRELHVSVLSARKNWMLQASATSHVIFISNCPSLTHSCR